MSATGSSQTGLRLPVAPSDLCGIGLPSDEGTDPVTQRTWVQAPGTYPAELDTQEFPLRSSLRLVEIRPAVASIKDRWIRRYWRDCGRVKLELGRDGESGWMDEQQGQGRILLFL